VKTKFFRSDSRCTELIDVFVRDIEIASGAGFIVVLTGEMTRMPGLPQIPSAEKIDVDEDGRILNLT
jgi:formate--tetrahydrofolate ligase